VEAVWRLGRPHTLYTPDPLAAGARWLVLAETQAAALRDGQADPLAGEAGKLLGNMLRAAQLPAAALALLVPLARQAAAGPGEAVPLPDAAAGLIASAQPDVVLIMGRLAAQAVLRTADPLGRLRGQVHRLHGVAAIVTYDAGYLLRNPTDKARAWDDLRLAMATVRGAA
jgi:uracil-DNA glycosylase